MSGQTISSEIYCTLKDHQNEDQKNPMQKYMKNQFCFFGIKTPERNKVFREVYNRYPNLTYGEIVEAAYLLFEKDERECQYAALSLLSKASLSPPVSSIAVYKDLLSIKPWWDTVDMISSNLCGDYFLYHRENLWPIIEKWSFSENMWVRRASIISQLRFKQQTDYELLFQTIDQLKEEKEFFIEKAIGWALREYSKTNPKLVINFIQTQNLSSLSKREALKWLKNRGSSITV
ncbi:DNA alkylation repair protein [Halobacillus campisalis]|uniref:DNA alkylation repair protein n=1 Tax=Halobacillus campisalis TaxID=435909 RepID=A0ABW2K3R8_9BACI|nr:DNA alkylation repair protein [Halobacillus campisalis]